MSNTGGAVDVHGLLDIRSCHWKKVHEKSFNTIFKKYRKPLNTPMENGIVVNEFIIDII